MVKLKASRCIVAD